MVTLPALHIVYTVLYKAINCVSSVCNLMFFSADANDGCRTQQKINLSKAKCSYIPASDTAADGVLCDFEKI